MAKEDEEMTFQVKGFVESTDVPSWTRREHKWGELTEIVRQLQPGQTIVIEFKHASEAVRARNVVRDTLNNEVGRAAFRTRVVKVPDAATKNEAEVYFTRLRANNIIEQDEGDV